MSKTMPIILVSKNSYSDYRYNNEYSDCYYDTECPISCSKLILKQLFPNFLCDEIPQLCSDKKYILTSEMVNRMLDVTYGMPTPFLIDEIYTYYKASQEVFSSYFMNIIETNILSLLMTKASMRKYLMNTPEFSKILSIAPKIIQFSIFRVLITNDKKKYLCSCIQPFYNVAKTSIINIPIAAMSIRYGLESTLDITNLVWTNGYIKPKQDDIIIMTIKELSKLKHEKGIITNNIDIIINRIADNGISFDTKIQCSNKFVNSLIKRRGRPRNITKVQ